MWHFEIDDPAAWCVSLFVMRLRCAKKAERIGVLRGQIPSQDTNQWLPGSIPSSEHRSDPVQFEND